MTMQLIPVPFRGTTLFVTDVDGQPFTPMKPIVEGMGLGWSGQHEKLNANKDRWGIRVIRIPTQGADQESICLPLRKLPGWLMTIQPTRVKPEIKTTIIAYQNECDEVLWQYWQKGCAENSADRFALPKSKAEALFLAAEQARIIEEQEAKLTEQEPKVLLYDQLAGSDGLIRLPNLLGMLKGKTGQDYKMADLKLFMRKAGMVCWQKEFEPTVKAIDAGWFAVRYDERHYDGEVHMIPEWAVTPKGFIAIWNVVVQPQRKYGQVTTQLLLTAANAAQQQEAA